MPLNAINGGVDSVGRIIKRSLLESGGYAHGEALSPEIGIFY